MTKCMNWATTPADAIQWLFDQAEAGDVISMRELGRMFFRGFTHPEDASIQVQPDVDFALGFLFEAVELGAGEAALLLGEMHGGEATSGYFEAPETAAARFQQAVALGCEQARFHLANCYLLGRGVERDEQRGLEIMIEAAYRGVADAQYGLSAIYRGFGDFKTASIWEVTAMTLDEKQVEPAPEHWVRKEYWEDIRFTLQRVKAYMLLVDCDDTRLMKLADQMRAQFLSEISIN